MMFRFGVSVLSLVIFLTVANPAHAWLATLGFFKSPQGLDKSWTPHWSTLLAYWPFENNYNDYSGNGHNGAPASSPAFSTTAKEGAYSVYLQGYSSVAMGSFMAPTYTKVAWINVTGVGSDNIISGGSPDQHAFWLNGCGALQLSGGHNNSWGEVCDPTPLTQGIWYHVAITYDSVSKVMILYKNGVQVSSATNIDNYTYTSGTVNVGSYDGNSNQFTGYIDEAAIWSTVLSPTDIQTIYSHQLVRH